MDRTEAFWTTFERALDHIGLTQTFAEATSPVGRGEPKFIKDAVWGMMEFSPDEIALIDCPLLQRLRGVRQLGFTPLTYPSAEHSRFAHTLGVATVVKRLLRSISEVHARQPSFRAGGLTYDLFNPEDVEGLVRCLVHSALLHDVGHLAFSHAGESAMKNCSDRLRLGPVGLINLVDIFRREGVRSDLSEILSVVICLSPRFGTFYGALTGEDPCPSIERICCFICGLAHEDGFAGLANIISGAVVDADKIDYILRDASACAIPIGIDVHRIFLNTSLVRLTREHLDRIGVGAMVRPGIHFVVNSSGIDTYDEIAHAKSTLFQRVYLHHATRNAEQLYAEAVSRLCRTGSEAGASRLDVLDFMHRNDQQMLDWLSGKSNVKGLVDRLAQRLLPKRAFLLFRDACEPYVLPGDVFEQSETEGGLGTPEFDASVRRLSSWRVWSDAVPRDLLEGPEKLDGLRARIREGAIQLRGMVDERFDPLAVNRSEPYVGFASRVTAGALPEVFVRQKNSIGRSVEWTTSEELTTAERVFKAADHVYADAEWAPFVRIATMRAIFEDGQRIGTRRVSDDPSREEDADPVELTVVPTVRFLLKEISGRLGIDYETVSEEMIAAAAKGFFGAAFRMAPLTSLQEEACADAATRLSKFSGERGWKVTPASTVAFIRQFPTDLRDEAVALVANFTLLDRVRLTGRLWDAVSPVLARPVAFCRFSPNSGNYAGMLFEQDRRDQLATAGHAFCRTPAELEILLAKEPERQVVFLDDQFGSGSQASAQLLQWAGTARDAWPEELRSEANIDLSEGLVAFGRALREGSVRLAFAYGTAEGRTAIETTATSLGLSGVQVVYGDELPRPPAGFSTEMRTFLEEVGKTVLSHVRCAGGRDAPPESCIGDAMGYGGIGALLATTYNVPSFTVPGFWCPGIVGGLPWVPLFLRRGYRKHLVFG